MNVKNYMKDQLENISDALILEAADTDLDYKSEGQIYYIKESFMDKIRKITTAAACFLLAVAAVIAFIMIRPLAGNEALGDSESDTEMKESLFDLDLTEREIAFVEDLTDRKFETLTEDDLTIYTTISIVGDHILYGEYVYYTRNGNDYVIVNDSYQIGSDYSDCLYLLKYFPKLKNIAIYFHNTLTDVSFLKDIPNLEKLTLYGTRVEDLTVLKNHPQFNYLDVAHSPVSKIEFHKNAVLDALILNSTFFGDLSILEGQASMTKLSIQNSFVPIINTKILSEFKSLNTLDLVAPMCDYSFFEEMSVAIPNVTLGGYDNVDLSVLKDMIHKMGSFGLYYSDGTDLTVLDQLPDDCCITLDGCNPGVRGTKTTEGSECLREHSYVVLKYPYYQAYFPEFLPEIYK